MARLLALYLPQYHTFRENDMWWGEGYTEWTAVKKAKPIYKGHIQPKVPQNNNYYDLSDPSGDTWKWQAELANKYGIYGFCIYNYWFCGKQLMEKPIDILLAHKEINLNYCICWANESWTRTWYGLEKEVLMEQTYGNEDDWRQHFSYLLKFFKDERYIKIDNKPVICIYHTHDISQLDKMRELWEQLSIEAGFNGIYIISGNTNSYKIEDRDDLVDAYYNFEPGYTLKHKLNTFEELSYGIRVFIMQQINKISKTKFLERHLDTEKTYKEAERKMERTDKNVYPGIFPQWDNTPRRAYKGLVYKYSSPNIFEKYLRRLIDNVKDDDFIFINAWNEWGEGAYLEPDEIYGHDYLVSIQRALEDKRVKSR